MPKRSLLFLAMVLVTLLGFYPLLAPPAHRIDAAHFEMIAAGMTRAQVESIFGVPAGDYDWAESDGPSLWFAPARALTVRRSTASVPGNLGVDWDADVLVFRKSSLVANELAIWDVYDRDVLIWGSLDTASTWTGKQGSFTIAFDNQGRVMWKSGPGEVKLVPPWQRWWRAWKK